MSRTTTGYLVMTVGSAAVLWCILRIGSHLQAAPDWSGQWQLVARNEPTTPVTIEQSGKFFGIRIGAEPSKSYTLERREDYSLLHGKDEVFAATCIGDRSGRTLDLFDRATHRRLILVQDAPR